MSRMPITASIEAAVVAGIPWSWAAGMKCTAIRPTVVAPQTKNDAASAQNVPVRIGLAQDLERVVGVRAAAAGSITVPP